MIVENQIEMRPINTVKPYVRNPRRNDKTVELLCKLIPQVGFNVPIVVDEKGIIVKGHARFTAAIHLGMKEVPVIVSHADEEAIKADRIADNKISEFSEWIGDDLIDEVNSINIDLTDIGLPKIDFSDMPSTEAVSEALEQVHEEAPVEPVDPIAREFEDNLYYKAVCDKCGYIMFIKEGELEDEL